MLNPLYLRAGELRHAVQIQSASSTRDAAGQPVSTWNVVLSTRAKIENSGSAGVQGIVLQLLSRLAIH